MWDQVTCPIAGEGTNHCFCFLGWQRANLPQRDYYVVSNNLRPCCYCGMTGDALDAQARAAGPVTATMPDVEAARSWATERFTLRTQPTWVSTTRMTATTPNDLILEDASLAQSIYTVPPNPKKAKMAAIEDDGSEENLYND
jgi:hypothetical protein